MCACMQMYVSVCAYKHTREYACKLNINQVVYLPYMVCNLGFKFPILSNFILSCEFFYQGGLQLLYPFEEIKHNFLVFI